jgi:NADH:ubiquinone oxidoreductase subunit 6 (subunit J)
MSNTVDAHKGSETTGEQRREAARQYVEQLRVFLIHAAVFAVGMIVIFVVNLGTNAAAGITGHWWAWWSGWALIGWGVAIAILGTVVRISRPGGSPSKWDEKQINRLLSSQDAEAAR